MDQRLQQLLAGNCLLLCFACSAFGAEPSVASLQVEPAAFTLRGLAARQQLIVTGTVSGRARDLTRQVTFRSESPTIATIDERGIVSPVADGNAVIVVSVDGREARAKVSISDSGRSLPVDFERDVQPIFSRLSCNAGACHGKARGQNGFQLSLLGFDSQFDFDALTKEARGRRVFPPDPQKSLLLQKPIGQAPHGGGKRIEIDSDYYKTLRRWIAAGASRSIPGTPDLERVTVFPQQRIAGHKEQQQLLVTAHYADGSARDVTRLAKFQSNESAIADVDENGLVSAGTITGEAAVMVRYQGYFAVCSIAVPLVGDVPADYYRQLPRKNYIDGHVWNKLERLGLKASETAPDHKFIRRAYIDVIGRVPTPDETRTFLKDSATDKRAKLVDDLLTQPEFAEHWANKWVDLLRPNPYRVGIKNTLNFDYWIRNSFRKNKPLDQFTRELLTAQGGTFTHGAATLFRDRRSPDELTTIVSQLFLGIRLECAKCHHHPFEVWGQDDFYSFAAYFAKVGRKGTGLSPPISGSEEIIFAKKSGTVSHPRTGEVLPPRPLFGTPPELTEGADPRIALANWITSKENPFFAKVMVNRVWADLMGRGVVEPIDDLRATNPPTNGPLLNALAEDFQNQGFDLKKLIKSITSSHVYGLSSLANDRNAVDTYNYSRHYRQRLRAEVLLDSISSITGVPEKFDAMPPGSRAKEIWTHRVSSLFLDAFGRPDPNQDPPCERTTDTTVVQVLHLMNSENLYRKVTGDDSTAAKLAASDKTPDQIVEELYLLMYSRFPEPEEIQVTRKLFEKTEIGRRQAAEDLMWALLNTPEFVFKD